MSIPYLSPAWIDAADALLRHVVVDPPVVGPAFTIETVVSDGPDDATGYVIEFDGPTVRARSTDADERSTVRLTQQYAVAAAVATGELGAQAAFLAADIQVGGDVATLINNAGLIAQVGDALRPLRSDTSFTLDA